MRLKHRTKSIAGALVAVLGLLAAMLLAGCGGSSGSSGSGSTGSNQPVRLLQSVAHPAARPDLTSVFQSDGMLVVDAPGTLKTIAALGGSTVRYNVAWSSLVPAPNATSKPNFTATDPGAYPQSKWSLLDTIDRDAKADGLTLYLTLTAPAPRWATQGGQPGGCGSCVGDWHPSARDYADFVTAIGRRYDGSFTPPGQQHPLPRVHVWSLWNEPNFGPNLAPQSTGTDATPVAAGAYRQLIDAGWNALQKTGHRTPGDSILIGETAPRGALDPGGYGMTPPLRFARALYCVGDNLKPLSGSAATALGCPSSSSAFVKDNPGLFNASGWADHPYPDGQSPTYVNSGPDFADWTPFGSLDKLETTLRRAESAYGHKGGLPIYNTEYGYFTGPNAKAGTGTSYTTAALYLNESEYLSYVNPWIHSYDQYLLVDPPAGEGHFVTGLDAATAGGAAPKPVVYDAYRLPLYLPRTSGSKGAKLQVWGCARPLITKPGGPHSVAIQFAAAGSHSYRTIDTVSLNPAAGGCYFDTGVSFPASGEVRLSYGSGAAQIFSRAQAIHIR